MNVNAVSSHNVNFKANSKAAKKESKYFTWISQNQVNNALMLTKGREVRNGKFVLAESLSTLTAIGTGIAAGILALEGKTPTAFKTLAATGAALVVKTLASSINKWDAMLTAKERGFTLESVNLQAKPRSFAKAYEDTSKVYNQHVV